MPRYEKGELVRIRDVISSRYAGRFGRVVAVLPNKRNEETLDKYVVVFPDGDQQEFWGIRLEHVPVES